MKINIRQCCFSALLAGGLTIAGTSASLAEDICELTYDAEVDPQAVAYCQTYCEVSNCNALDGTESQEEAEACQALYDQIVDLTGTVPPC